MSRTEPTEMTVVNGPRLRSGYSKISLTFSLTVNRGADSFPRAVSSSGSDSLQARSSVGEHFLDVEGVGGSIPPVPTK